MLFRGQLAGGRNSARYAAGSSPVDGAESGEDAFVVPGVSVGV